MFQLRNSASVLNLQKVIWGFADIELLPLRFLVVVSKIGGHVFGAYDGSRMVGFCFALPGVKDGGRPYLHSHMLGVLPRVSQCRHRTPPETAPARGRAGPRHRTDRVDLRSAGTQERFLQY